MKRYNILVLNPGSTSDEISFYQGRRLVFHKTVRYSPEELKPYEGKKITSQYKMRLNLALETLKENNVSLKEIGAVIGRGGLVKPIKSGVYKVNQKLLEDLKVGVMGEHSSNLGGIIAEKIASMCGVESFIADPVVVDEMEDIAKFSGMPENPRISIFHALNQKRVARHAARQLGKQYEDCNLIVVHGGGGISAGAHRKGKVIDVNNALNGDGPFTPQRSGGVPAGGLVKMCFSGKYTEREINLKLKGRGGLVAYTGTSDLMTLEKYIQTGEVLPNRGLDENKITRKKAKETVEAMTYQMAKEVGALAVVLGGEVDAIILTGGLGYDEVIVPFFKKMVSWISMVLVYPGGDEMSALRIAAQSALSHPKTVREYK
ncbi:MAG: butyrate kinase [Elusimicrobia bacterium]|nr:butyrate kinase [Elusimicrobiota bacterium]